GSKVVIPSPPRRARNLSERCLAPLDMTSHPISRAARPPRGGTCTGGMLEIPGRVYMMEYCGGRVSLKQGQARGEHRVWPSGRIHGAEAMRRKKPCAGSTTVAVTLAVFLLFFTLITLYLF